MTYEVIAALERKIQLNEHDGFFLVSQVLQYFPLDTRFEERLTNLMILQTKEK